MYLDIGADVLDQTGEQMFGVRELTLEPTYWELTDTQKNYQDFIQQVKEPWLYCFVSVLWKNASEQHLFSVVFYYISLTPFVP